MSDNRKEQERDELHRTIWNIANDLRGSVDGWDFKQYVLGMLFYRYISENISAYINAGEREAGNNSFCYAVLSDEDAEQARADLVATKGFFILPSELFENVWKQAVADENLNETLEKVFKSIESSAQGTDSEANFKGLFDDIDVNSNKLGGTVAKTTSATASTGRKSISLHTTSAGLICSCTMWATTSLTLRMTIRLPLRSTGTMNRLRRLYQIRLIRLNGRVTIIPC
jgi:type I restriction-modification system DNA methylase subunit